MISSERGILAHCGGEGGGGAIFLKVSRAPLSVGQSLIVLDFRLEIAIASPSFVSDLSVPKSLVIKISKHRSESVFRRS